VTESYKEYWALAMERELDLLEPAVRIIEKAGVTPSSTRQMREVWAEKSGRQSRDGKGGPEMLVLASGDRPLCPEVPD
jgi:hypothetical protein